MHIINLNSESQIEAVVCDSEFDWLLVTFRDNQEVLSWTPGSILSGGYKWKCLKPNGRPTTILVELISLETTGDPKVWRLVTVQRRLQDIFQDLKVSAQYAHNTSSPTSPPVRSERFTGRSQQAPRSENSGNSSRHSGDAVYTLETKPKLHRYFIKSIFFCSHIL
jgi:hypothetical protein